MNHTRTSSGTLFLLTAFLFVQSLSAAPVISSIGGWSAGSSVSNGKWTGQPSSAPNRGKYVNYYAVDSDSSYQSYWTINGSGFGNFAGKVTFSDGNIRVGKLSWSASRITVYVTVPYTYTYRSSVTVTVTAADKSIGSKAIPVVATIKSRGYGQCTWFVAKTRQDQGLSAPTPSAYTTTATLPLVGQVTSFEPKRWDVINFGAAHTSIITSAVSAQTVTNADGSRTLTYSFTIGEMNVVPFWGEQQSSVSSKFVVKIDKNGRRTVVSGILSKYSASKVATAYYRTAIV